MQIERMIEKLYQQPFIEIEQIHYHLLNIKEYEKSLKYDIKILTMKTIAIVATTGGTIAGTGKKGKPQHIMQEKLILIQLLKQFQKSMKWRILKNIN